MQPKIVDVAKLHLGLIKGELAFFGSLLWSFCWMEDKETARQSN